MTDAFRPRSRCTLALATAVAALAVATASACSSAQKLSVSTAPTPDIHYVPTSAGVADAMLKLAQVTADDVVYDLGSGDGRIVIAAAQKYGASGVGVEVDAELVKEARKNAMKAGVSDRVTFVQDDLFKANLSDATVVTLYLSNSINMRLRSLLQQELKPGSRVVSHRFEMGDWKPEATVRLEGTSIHLWTIQ